SRSTIVNAPPRTNLTFAASRWRFFATTTISSLSIGVAIYCLTEWLGIPYGWAVFIVVIRAAFWATVVDIRKFDINIEGKTLSGPTFIFGSKQASVDLADVEPGFVGECMGAFSLHDSTGEEVMAHYRYYTPKDRAVLRRLVDRLRWPRDTVSVG
ncbi:hypothetical protein, partial [Rhodopirellula europaea]|uniref:hypothetical protein n=1 Tax=Rhodopirellula europaea TaxID=1263866 RepID=UPI001F2E6ED5